MRIAVVGAGDRCVRLMEILEQHEFHEVQPRIVAVSDIDDHTFGYRLAQQKGLYTTTDFRDILKRTDIDLIIELSGKPEIFQYLLTHKDNRVRLISSRTVQLFWEISHISHLQKKTNQVLQETQATYKMIMDELIQEDVLIINYNYRIRDINQKLLSRLGLQREEVIGRFCYEITHHRGAPCRGDDHPCPLVKTLETGQPNKTTHVHLDKNGRELYYSISTYPMIADGDVLGAVEISHDNTRDITVQKTMMQQEKLASIGRLSAGVAHEINNPLTTILTSAMLIQEDMSPQDPAYEELTVITNEALRCRKIVTSLLDFARQTKSEKKMIHINAIVAESVLLTQKQAAFKDIAVNSELGPNIPEQKLDKGQIQQALINLILNAVEATEPGGEISVRTSFDTGKNASRISVRDTGSGIAAENLDKIFEPFFTTKEMGTGLGLAITHGIVEQHGGIIAVESKPGIGTMFAILLPAETKAR